MGAGLLKSCEYFWDTERDAYLSKMEILMFINYIVIFLQSLVDPNLNKCIICHITHYSGIALVKPCPELVLRLFSMDTCCHTCPCSCSAPNPNLPCQSQPESAIVQAWSWPRLACPVFTRTTALSRQISEQFQYPLIHPWNFEAWPTWMRFFIRRVALPRSYPIFDHVIRHTQSYVTTQSWKYNIW